MAEADAQRVVAECLAEGVLIGVTNRSLDDGFNTTLCLSPALIVTRQQIDTIIAAMDTALDRVFG